MRRALHGCWVRCSCHGSYCGRGPLEQLKDTYAVRSVRPCRPSQPHVCGWYSAGVTHSNPDEHTHTNAHTRSSRFFPPAAHRMMTQFAHTSPAKSNAAPSQTDNAAGTEHPSASDGASENPPTVAPREYVVGLYNAYAETFDSHLQEALEYRTPAVIVETLVGLFPGRR